MDAISKKINELREEIKKQKRNKIIEESEIKKALETFFKFRSAAKFVRGFYIKNKNLVIETGNKTFASEVFLKREKLKEILAANGVFVEEVVIR